MTTALVLVALWLAFGASHMALSSLRLRPRLVAALGEGPFLGLYSATALAIFVPLVAVYFRHKHAGPHLWSLGALPGLRGAMMVGMGVVFCLLVAGLLRPSPASVAPGRAEVAGVYRVTRHPVLMALGLFGALHLLVVSVNAAELAFFAGFPLFTVVGARHQDRRKLATAGEGFRRFHDATPFLPFSQPSGVAALGREQPLAVGLGVALAVGVRWIHPAVFGL